ncbi:MULTISPECIES: metallophosphoesterase [unclassified Rhizobium]|uniref:metallophosphoesterase n=1 Tax=unclassified Rhizobium TaxID=2613769 RepID=UPI001AE1A780|nr:MULTISPECIES: metallophosphoesterase [unclassified Rhizobium]MBP2460466.1 Icc-related predicted phosphoesterase [Rhizobium sp. PvP014]
MRAWIFSDLHIETNPEFKLAKIPDADVCICAGDVLDGGVIASILWLAEFVAPHMPVVFVPGNHEYYRSSIKEGLTAGYKLAEAYDNLFMLDGDSVVLGGYRFIGATLWTNFDLHDEPRLAMAIAKDELNDYRRIKLSKTPFKRFSPQESLHLHCRAAIDIDNVYRSQPILPTVIISHHAPSLMSVPRHFLKDGLTPSFASRFEYRILEYEPLLWVHGHIHSPSDYLIGRTRVICNPLGYPGETSRQSFIPNLVIDLAALAKT